MFSDIKPAHEFEVSERRTVWVTAFSSSPDETDDTPFITASGKVTHHGVLAANFLPFGTKVRIPALFKNRIFVVEDRMHPRKAGFVDIWMSSKGEALDFGIHQAEIEIITQI